MKGIDIIKLADRLYRDGSMRWTRLAFHREKTTFAYLYGRKIVVQRGGSCLLGGILEHMGISRELLERYAGVVQLCPKLVVKAGMDINSITNAAPEKHQITLDQGKELRLLEQINDQQDKLSGVLGRIATDYSDKDFPVEALFAVFHRMQEEEETLRYLRSIGFASRHLKHMRKAIEKQPNTSPAIAIGFQVDVVQEKSKQKEPVLV